MTAAAVVVVIQLVVLSSWWPRSWAGSRRPGGIGCGAAAGRARAPLAFGALGVLLGGALRAEIVLALANIIWFVLLLAGGAGIASPAMPTACRRACCCCRPGRWPKGSTPRSGHGVTPLWESAVVLLGWGAVAAVVATRTTKLS